MENPLFVPETVTFTCPECQRIGTIQRIGGKLTQAAQCMCKVWYQVNWVTKTVAKKEGSNEGAE